MLVFSKIPWSCTDSLVDAGGQYLLLKSKIGGKSDTSLFLCPNIQQDIFFRTFLNTLLGFQEGQLIMGGGLNIPLVPSEDTSSEFSAAPPDFLATTGSEVSGCLAIVSCRRLLFLFCLTCDIFEY